MLEWYQNKRKTYVKMNEEPNIDLNRSLNAQLDSIENKGTSQFELEMRANLTIDGQQSCIYFTEINGGHTMDEL